MPELSYAEIKRAKKGLNRERVEAYLTLVELGVSPVSVRDITAMAKELSMECILELPTHRVKDTTETLPDLMHYAWVLKRVYDMEDANDNG